MDGTILFVCHANLCRSPMAEYLARDLLAGSGIGTASAGTHARPDRPMHPHAARIAVDRGLDPTPFRSRALNRADLAGADLVLTASRRERAACVTLSPAVLSRAFTLRQFARLATAALRTGLPSAVRDRGVPSLRAAVGAAVRARALVQGTSREADDLLDPVDRSARAFRDCAGQIDSALAAIVGLIVSSEQAPTLGRRRRVNGVSG